VSNPAGTVVSSAAQLTVNPADTPSAPVITSQPQNQTVTTGQSVSFAVVASGSNLRYQWRKNGANLANASNANFAIAAASLNDAGSYSVLVSNDAGSVASSEAVLTVNAATGTELINNGGFENGSSPWQGSTATVGDFSSYGHAAYKGKQMAWFGGYGKTATENLYQQITIPTSVSSAQLRFYLRIATAETASTARDKLVVQILSSSGTVLGTAATYSNLQASAGYQPYSLDLSAYKGKTVRVNFKMTEDAQNQTSFFLDEVSLMVQ
ncbi:MAG: immunoglobulin domain-containing protein, partial [Burkholderiales bacterium]|nr:immunoglobulin domain-containing protein [Burkholderiales bacterium]